MKMSHFRVLRIVIVGLIIVNGKESSAQLKVNNSSKKISSLKETSRSGIKDYSYIDSSIPVNVPGGSSSSNSESSPYEVASASNIHSYQYYPSPSQFKRKKWCPYGSSYGRCLPRQDDFGFEDDYSDSGDDFGLGSLGGLAGLAGLLGLAGAKGLVPWALLKLPFVLPFILPIAAPILLPLLLPLLLPILLLLFLPIPVITIPQGRSGRTSPDSPQTSYVSVIHLASTLAGEECIERISCEIASRGTGYKMVDWIKKFVEESPIKENQWLKRVQSGIQMNTNSKEEGKSCQKLTCTANYF